MSKARIRGRATTCAQSSDPGKRVSAMIRSKKPVRHGSTRRQCAETPPGKAREPARAFRWRSQREIALLCVTHANCPRKVCHLACDWWLRLVHVGARVSQLSRIHVAARCRASNSSIDMSDRACQAPSGRCTTSRRARGSTERLWRCARASLPSRTYPPSWTQRARVDVSTILCAKKK